MIKLKTLIDVLLSLLIVRFLIKGASIGDSLAFISLSACYSYHEYIKFKQLVLENQKKPDLNKDLIEKIEFLEKKTNSAEAKIATLTLAGRIR